MAVPQPDRTFYAPMVICRDFAASFRFYRELVGLSTDSDGSPPWAEFQSDGVRLVLLAAEFWNSVTGTDAGAADGSPGGGLVLAMQVKDVDATVRAMIAAGQKFIALPRDVPPMGLRIAMTRDPDGHLIELSTMLTRVPSGPSAPTPPNAEA